MVNIKGMEVLGVGVVLHRDVFLEERVVCHILQRRCGTRERTHSCGLKPGSGEAQVILGHENILQGMVCYAYPASLR